MFIYKQWVCFMNLERNRGCFHFGNAAVLDKDGK